MWGELHDVMDCGFEQRRSAKDVCVVYARCRGGVGVACRGRCDIELGAAFSFTKSMLCPRWARTTFTAERSVIPPLSMLSRSLLSSPMRAHGGDVSSVKVEQVLR